MTANLHPLIALCLLIILAVFCIECVLYYTFAAGYYRRGPTSCREEWQTSASVEAVSEIIRGNLKRDGLVGRPREGGFCIRQSATTFSTFPRVWLGVRAERHGAVLSFQVRPFLAMIPTAIVMMMIVGLRMTGVFFGGWKLPVLTTVVIAATYKRLLPYDVRRIGRLRTIRRALAPLGLRVCDGCGYDLFGRPEATVCPECGAATTRPA